MADQEIIFWITIIILILSSASFSLLILSFFAFKDGIHSHNPPTPKENPKRFKKVLNKDGRTMVLRDRLKPVYNDDEKLYRDEISQS